MTLNEAHPPAPIALDTNLFVRATVRRMLCGAQELCGSHVLVPAEVARECDVPYAAVAGRRSRREAEWNARERWGRDWTPAQRTAIAREVAERTGQRAAGFKCWVLAEGRRNDSPYTVGARVPEDLPRAYRVAAEGYERDESWGKGDPLLIAQAAREGAEFVATENVARVRRAALDGLVREWQREGVCPKARTPFVRTPDEALFVRIGAEEEEVFDRRCARLAYASCRPRSLEGWSASTIVAVVDRFWVQLEIGGMSQASEAVERERDRWRLREPAWVEALEADLRLPERTRAAEDRRMDFEDPVRAPAR